MSQAAEHPIDSRTDAPQRVVYGVIGEYDDVTTVMNAATKFRDAGFKRWDVYSPFPIHGIDKAMGTKPTILPWIVLVCGLTGMLSGIVLCIFTMATEFQVPYMPWVEGIIGYPYLISGKPYNSFPAYIAVIFELTILLSAFGAVFGMFILNKLPMLYNPLLTSDRFRRATNDRFYIGVEARDGAFDEDKVSAMLRDTGASAVETIEE